MAILIGEVVANMTGDTTALDHSFNAAKSKGESTAQSISKSFDQLGNKFVAIGGMLTKSITAPILGMATGAVWAFNKQAQAIAQVEQGIRSTGGAAGYTSKQLQDMASSLQENSLFGDEDILKGVTAQLLTFTNIAGNEFARTQQAALDLAQRLGGDLQGASIQLGKALNDPVANLSALSRSGIQFSKDQKAMINSLVETGRLADAQRIILSELEKQYGGSAKAAADAGAGGIIQLKNSMGDLMEQFGEIINDAIKPFVSGLGDMVRWFQSLDKDAKRTIVGIATAIAVVPPILIGIGIALKGIAIAVAAITSPVTLVIGAFAALSAAILYIWDNWKAIKERISDIAWWQNILIDMVQWVIKYNPFSFLAQSYVEMMQLFGRDVQNPFVNLADGLDSLRMSTNEYEHEFGSFMDAVKSGISAVGGLFKTAEDTADEIEEMGGAISTVNAEGKQIPEWASSAMRPFVSLRQEVVAIADASKEINSALSGISVDNFDFIIPKGSIADLESQAQSIQQLMKVATSPERYAELEGQLKAINEQIAIMNGSYLQTSPVLEAIQPIVDNFVNSFGQGMANIVVQGGKLVDVLNNIGRLLLSSAIQKGISILLSGGLSSAGEGFFGSGGGLFGALFGRGRAIGGPVNMMQPYIVGERGPELFVPQGAGNIVPTHMMNGGGQPVTVYVRGRISGKDILFMQENGRRALR